MAYVVIATWTAREGASDQVAAAIAKLVEPARAEPGMLLYQCHRDPDDLNVFSFYEQYRSADDYQAHIESPHMQEHAFGNAIPLLESRERRFFETWEPA